MISNTLNPTWDQTLILPHVTLFGRAEELRDDPPVVIIEVFDKDLVVSELNFTSLLYIFGKSYSKL